MVVDGYPARDLNFSSRKNQYSWLLGVRDKFWRLDLVGLNTNSPYYVMINKHFQALS